MCRTRGRDPAKNEVGEKKAPGVALKAGRKLGKPSMKYEFRNAEGEKEDFLEQDMDVEMSPRHPGDLSKDDAPVSNSKSVNPRFQPVTTKIHFVTPGGEATGELVSAYPSQLCVRVDPARKMLIYDACDHLPELVLDFYPTTQRRAFNACKTWNRLTSQLDHDRSPAAYTPTNVMLHPHLVENAQDCPQHWEAPKPKQPTQPAHVPQDNQMLLYYKANFCDLCESSVHRVRFPLASVIGLRLQPGKKPSAKDDHLSVPHVLILELRHATRHYIYGEANELTELALYLLEICPELKAVYNGGGNTLHPRAPGATVCLAPSVAPPSAGSALGGHTESAAAAPLPCLRGVIPGLAGWQRWYDKLICNPALGGAYNPDRLPLASLSGEQMQDIARFVRVQGQVSIPPLVVLGLMEVCDTLGLIHHATFGDDGSGSDDDVSMGVGGSSSRTEEDEVPPRRHRCSRPGCNMEGEKQCGGCRSVRYCSPGCQKMHCKSHRAACKAKQSQAA
eukprot:jgi/Tetstr1/437451/TSEL_026130.t1